MLCTGDKLTSAVRSLNRHHKYILLCRVCILFFMGIVIGVDWYRHISFPCKRWCFLTNWSYDLLAIHIFVSIVSDVTGRYADSRVLDTLFELSTTAAVSVTVTYYAAVVWKEQHELTIRYWFSDLGVHFLNSTIAMYEITVSHRKWDSRRVWVPALYSVVYAVYNYLQWKLGGVVIYEGIEYDSLSKVMNSIGTMGLGILVSVAAFACLGILRERRTRALQGADIIFANIATS